MKYVWNIGDYATWQRQQDKYEDEENSTCDLWMCVSVDERINNTDRWLCVRERVFELWNRYSQKAHRPYIFVNRDWQWRIGESNRWKDLSCCCGELCTSTTQDNSHSLSHMHFICFPFWTVRERLPPRCKQNELRLGVFNIINTHTLSHHISTLSFFCFH